MYEQILKSIEVLEKPSNHIKCVHKCRNGMDFFTYSQDLVAAFETAIVGLKELQRYRSIGTIEECRMARGKHNRIKHHHTRIDHINDDCRCSVSRKRRRTKRL